MNLYKYDKKIIFKKILALIENIWYNNNVMLWFNYCFLESGR